MSFLMGLERRVSRVLGLARLFLLGLLTSATPLSAQPRLEAFVSTDAPRLNEAFQLTLEVSCPGKPDRYVLYPPTLEIPATVTRGAVNQSFSTKEQDTLFRYDYTLVATVAGPISLGTAKVDYRDLEAAAADSSSPLEVELPTLAVAPGGVKGLAVQSLPLVLGGAALLFYLYWRRRRLTRKQEPAPAPAAPSAGSLLLEARQALTDGELDRAYLALAQIKPLLPAEDDPLPSVEQLEAEKLRVRYGGVSGVQPELERLIRAVEIIIK